MSTTDSPGSALLANRYRLVERLGAGGMSVVWRAFDEVLGRRVAVKVLTPSTSADPLFRRRLRAEAQAAARLSHPHITDVYDYGEATTVDGEPVPFVVMELVQGESLAALLARTRVLPWEHAVRIAADVAGGLAAAHARGIVHRDVTPANVMLPAGGAKLVDFGISALIGENDIGPDGSLLGTPAYLAPERLEGGQVSPATDVYAVGLLIYRMLIGQLPWDVATTTALVRAHQYVPPDPLPPVEGLPAAVAELVGRCLEKQPQDRPSSAELAKVLTGVAADAPAGTLPDGDAGDDDTTILPQRSYPDVIGLDNPVADDPPLRPASGEAEPATNTVPRVTSRLRSRRAMTAAAAAAVLLLGAGVYAGSRADGGRDRGGPRTTTTALDAMPATGKCVVAYAVLTDRAGRFTARVTVANRGDTPISPWSLWFILPGDQVLAGGGKTPVTQTDSTVTVASTRPLGPMKSITLPVSGGYQVSNSAPLAFRLNNSPCDTFVSAKPGEPVRLVQHQPNGEVRLVPLTAGSTPIPGVSIDPDGGVHLTPVTPTPSSTGTGSQPSQGPGSPPTSTVPDTHVAPAPPTEGVTPSTTEPAPGSPAVDLDCDILCSAGT